MASKFPKYFDFSDQILFNLQVNQFVLFIDLNCYLIPTRNMRTIFNFCISSLPYFAFLVNLVLRKELAWCARSWEFSIGKLRWENIVNICLKVFPNFSFSILLLLHTLIMLFHLIIWNHFFRIRIRIKQTIGIEFGQGIL